MNRRGDERLLASPSGRVRWALWSIMLFVLSGAGHAALACGPADYQKATVLLADSSLRADSSVEEADGVLRACAGDPMAAYLLGMFPRFAELPPTKREEYRQLLSRAAEQGVPAAEAIYGIWLFDTEKNRALGAQLVIKAYAAEDEWGLWFGYRLLSAQGTRLSPADMARVERLSANGFPLAYGILAGQELYRISDDRDRLSTEEQANALIKARQLALQGVVRGDDIALLATRRVEKEFDVRPRKRDELEDALAAPDPVDFASSDPKGMESAHIAWQLIFQLNELDNSPDALIKRASRVCFDSIPSKLAQLCEIRAVIDHYICMEPFSSYMDTDQWWRYSAYRTCRLLRLRVEPTTLFY